jgi:hypothetical protein
MATPQLAPFPPPDAQPQKPFSPVDDEPPLRWQRTLHLVPASSLGVTRRAVVLALASWIPIAIWAWSRGRFIHTSVGEPLLAHYGVHVRCLVAIPLLIIGEATLHRASLRYFPQFVTSGLVDDTVRPGFEATIRAARRWRDASLPWLSVIAVALAWALVDRAANHPDEMSWALESSGSFGFGGVWFAYVVRPIFLALLLGWLWRIVLLVVLFARLARLNLSFVPSHPDRAGGIGFLERLPSAFAPVGLALSATFASRWAHTLVYHGQPLKSFQLPAVTFAVLWSLLLIAPLVPLFPKLLKVKRAALPSYSAMVAEQGRAIRRRWIEGSTKIEGPVLEPEGIGVAADAATMYGQVRAMRSTLIGKTSLAAILLPIIVPILIVVALQIPIKTLLLGLAKALM